MASSSSRTSIDRTWRAVRAGGLDALGDQLGGVAARPAAVVLVLADDDLVEVAGRHPAELEDVLVAAVAGGGDDADAPAGDRSPRAARRRLGQPVDELAERRACAGGLWA